jgi:hypothetical protein
MVLVSQVPTCPGPYYLPDTYLVAVYEIPEVLVLAYAKILPGKYPVKTGILSKPSAIGVGWSFHDVGEEADRYFLVLDRCSNTSDILSVKYLRYSIAWTRVLHEGILFGYLYLRSQVPTGITLVSGYRPEYTIVKVKVVLVALSRRTR